MGFLIRALLLVSLVTSAGSLMPLAQATDSPAAAATPSQSSGPSASGSGGSSTGPDAEPTGSSSAPEPGDDPVAAPTTSPTADPATADPGTADPGTADPGTADPGEVQPSGSSDEPADRPTGPVGTGRSGPALAARETAVGVQTEITSQPLNPATTGIATFTYAANVPHDVAQPGAQFECTLTGPGRTTATPATCPVDAVTSATTTTGRITYRGLTASRSRYTFRVQVVIPAGVAPATSDDLVGAADAYSWNVFTAGAPDNFSPRTGPSFNRPLSTSSLSRRTNLRRVIRTIDSMPGYTQAYSDRFPSLCPRDPALLPGTIRISLYSLTDLRVANALISAHRRCLSVQVLMNNHLDRNTNPALRRLQDNLGATVSSARRSFAHRCSGGCRGGGVMHTKMYLFNSTVPKSTRNTIVRTVFFGSSNMTQNASGIQYNDLYGVRNDRTKLYDQFNRMFVLMSRDDGFRRNAPLPATGAYRATFWPLQKPGLTDPYLNVLRAVRCTSANGGTGIGGRTVVYVNMHAWFGERGLALADQARRLYARGCYVRVLYSFMSYTVFKKLASGANSRMSVRRTAFSRNGETAYVYTHFKSIAISGHLGSDRSSKVVYTGSNNFTNFGMTFDEVMVRISSAAMYGAYARQFAFIRDRLSSTTYANYGEPVGGGRAP